MNEEREREILELSREAGAMAVAVSYRDLETGESGAVEGDRWFHAASTMKLPVLLGLYDAIERDSLRENARLHVRNQFTSLADGRYFRVSSSRDGNQAVHRHVGRTMRVRDLARHMIVTSSNLATNVLVELLGPEGIRGTLERHGIEGFEFQRGVEDDRAWAAGISNRVTANGLATLLEAVAEERAVSAAASREMLEILHDQEFVSGIPAGAPGGARVANKTGEISTVTHDAGIVYVEGRRPYVLVVLTEWSEEGDAGSRRSLIADVSRLLLSDLLEAADG
jgi:beta-lactamase class A